MWPFTRKVTNAEVLERLESLERRFKTLLADVDEYFQLVRRAENRIKEKRARMEPEANSPPAEGIGDGMPATPDPFAHLSPKQRLIQSQILARRTALKGGVQ